MAESDNPQRRHFIVQGEARSEQFRSIGTGRGQSNHTDRDRHAHGGSLLNQINSLVPAFERAGDSYEQSGVEEGIGLQLEFKSFPGIDLALEYLDRESQGIELRNVRYAEDRVSATVFVPDGKLSVFERLVRQYLDESKDSLKSGLPRNANLLSAIEEIRTATLEALWTDDLNELPSSDQESIWWEIWVPRRNAGQESPHQLIALLNDIGFKLAEGELQLAERTVLLGWGSPEQLKSSVVALSSIAELRRAKETAEFFDALSLEEQIAWRDNLLSRCRFANEDVESPRICLLDTGVNRGHPIISSVLSDADMHTVEPGWGVDDRHGHGTEMAGLATFGNLTDVLVSDDPIPVGHRLESVKLLPHDGANSDDPSHHGYLTVEAVSTPEVSGPNLPRLFSMSVNTKDNRDRGQPSAWSAAIDRLAAAYDEEDGTPRLFIISAGNFETSQVGQDYADRIAIEGVHDPGQSWNALTVGAATTLSRVEGPDTESLRGVAPLGGLSPFTTTSVTWKKTWPIKPDVVCEGGNIAHDEFCAVSIPSLSLLTTHHRLQERLFTCSNGTSAATALVSRMAAQVMIEYPQLWPETVRAVIVHSADWTHAMRHMHLPSDKPPNKTDMDRLARHCGFGIPDLERALWSLSNSLVLVCEDHLQPFERLSSGDPTFAQMNLHALPWPHEELESLGETVLEMRVTLSYFIEPNPSRRAYKGRYAYQSHGLRFDVKRAQESEVEFRKRINKAAREEGEQYKSTASDDVGWLLGTQNRHKGSLHADIWQGTAADLASRGHIAVYPATGWWKTKKRLKRYDSQARYALLVSIHAPEVDIDLYSAVSNKIAASVAISV